jgi:hypothetical protein
MGDIVKADCAATSVLRSARHWAYPGAADGQTASTLTAAGAAAAATGNAPKSGVARAPRTTIVPICRVIVAIPITLTPRAVALRSAIDDPCADGDVEFAARNLLLSPVVSFPTGYFVK